MAGFRLCLGYFTAQKMTFSIKDLFSKCDQIRLVTFTEEILNRKLYFLCCDTTDFSSENDEVSIKN